MISPGARGLGQTEQVASVAEAPLIVQHRACFLSSQIVNQKLHPETDFPRKKRKGRDNLKRRYF